ncbi:MAG: L-threonylcarbamoyladenylate synthase [Hyphomicrobiaceae bacterium]
MPIQPATPETFATASSALIAGRLVAFPTETVYGLGALATDSNAVASIFETKARPQLNPLIVHVANQVGATKLARFSDDARKLADAFWPGPLTLVLEMLPTAGLSPLVTAGNDTVAIRVPAHPVAQQLLAELAQPIAAPSANKSGHVSPTTAAHVHGDLGTAVAHIIDGGATTLGLESTIVDVSQATPILLRPGSITPAMLSKVLGQDIAVANKTTKTPNAPGQLASHYAPRAKIRLNAKHINPGEALLAFGRPPNETPDLMVNLSENGDLVEAAANLFAALRELDAQRPEIIAVMSIPPDGLGIAINDRLARAAAPRP